MFLIIENNVIKNYYLIFSERNAIIYIFDYFLIIYVIYFIRVS